MVVKHVYLTQDPDLRKKKQAEISFACLLQLQKAAEGKKK